MTFDELVQEVVNVTKRPDLLDRIKSNVKAATLKAHHSDFYFRDLHEVAVQFNDPFYLQSFIPTEVAPRFRMAKYIRLWNYGNSQNYAHYADYSEDPRNGLPGRFLENIQIENSVDAYGCNKPDVFYMAGQLLQIRGSAPLNKVLFGYYQHPVVTPETAYESWIAVDMPYVIIYEAARVTFKSVSYSEQANEYSQLVAELFSELKMTYIDSVPLT